MVIAQIGEVEHCNEVLRWNASLPLATRNQNIPNNQNNIENFVLSWKGIKNQQQSLNGNYCIRRIDSQGMTHSMDHTRLKGVLYPHNNNNIQYTNLRLPQKLGASPKKRDGKKSKRSTLQLAEDSKSMFATNFCGLLKEHSVAVPPSLLRPSAPIVPASASFRQKDASAKLRVSVRLVPNNSRNSPETCAVTVDPRLKQVQVTESPTGRTPAQPKHFTFDATFAQDDSLTEISSSSLSDVLQTVVSGHDATLLCFGQSATDKKQTIIGSDSSPQSLGLMPTCISWLYRMIQDRRQRFSGGNQAGTRFSIRVSAMQVNGPNETLTDLLKDYSTDLNSCGELSLEDDAVMGPQVQNLTELRAPSAEKAAFFLDAAINARRSAGTEDSRNSHFFLTLHVYQYKVESGKSGVAGGRSRLHLIDLGSGERNSKPNRTALTFPALGNVLLTLLQGQKYLPFKESKLTQLLRETCGSANCRAVSVIACISSEQEKTQETLNTLQIAHKIYKIKKNKKKCQSGVSQNHSGGESSCTSGDDRRRRIHRSASDPEATSSSEHSCDTVIYLGGPRNQHQATNSNSAGETTSDGETVVPITVKRPPAKTSVQPNLPRILEGENMRLPGVGSAPNTPRFEIAKPTSVANLTGPYYSPQIRKDPTENNRNPRWIDGPKAQGAPTQESLRNAVWVDGPHSSSTSQDYSCDLTNYSVPKAADNIKPSKLPKMDPFKRDMIFKWVTLQEQENAKFTPDVLSTTPVSKLSIPLLTPSPIVDTVMSMDTSSEWSTASKEPQSSKQNVEMKDSAVQIDEAEIDFDLGRVTDENHLMWTQPDTEIRFLEDIQEENESDCHSASSHRSGRQSRIMQRRKAAADAANGLPLRNEAMATPPDVLPPLMTSFTSTNSSCAGKAIIDLALTSLESMNASDSHPLSILSRDHSGKGDANQVQSLDTFSITSDQLEAMSLPGTDQLTDDEPMDDDDLERAMQASMTSIRSHEILSRLKCEAQYQSLLEAQREQNCPSLSNCGADFDDYLLELRQQPDGAPEIALTKEAVKMKQKECLGPIKSSAHPVKEMFKRLPNPSCPTKLVCCSQATASLTDSSNSNQMGHSGIPNPISSSLKSEKLQRPSIPVISKEVSMEITRELTSKVPSINGSMRSNTGSLDQCSPRRPNQLSTSSMCSSGIGPVSGLTIPKAGWGRRDSNQTISSKGSSSGKTSTSKKDTHKKKCRDIPVPSSSKTQTKNSASGTEEKTTSPSSGGIIGFLRSPTRLSGRKSTPKLQPPAVIATTAVPKPVRFPGSRLSCGYDSGQDSGIGGTTTASDSPELITGFVSSPYWKITAPRPNQRTSSGHGSDNSSVTSNKPPNAGKGRASSSGSSSRLPTFGFLSGNKSCKASSKNCGSNRQSIAASSGYESASRSDNGAPADSGSEVEVPKSAVKSPQSVKPSRKKYFTFSAAFSRSKSAPQSPCNHQRPAHTKIICPNQMLDENAMSSRISTVSKLEESQRFWMKELEQAKDRLSIARDRWSYDLHASECMSIADPGFVESLQQETNIMQKRVLACRNHICMVTCFDSKPSVITEVSIVESYIRPAIDSFID